jgi:hypothetical protein
MAPGVTRRRHERTCSPSTRYSRQNLRHGLSLASGLMGYVPQRTDEGLPRSYRRHGAVTRPSIAIRCNSEITMNTPRQPNVRTPIEQFPGEIWNSGNRTPVPTSSNAAFNPDSKPAPPVAPPSATAKDVIPGSVATVRITGTLRLPLAAAAGRQILASGQPNTVPAK